MGSKGRIPPAHLRHPLPGPGIGHPDAFVPGMPMRPPHGGFPPYDMLPPPVEVMERKLAGQHMEMQKLATENQRLAATHGTLRHDLAAIQHELQMVHAHVGAAKSEKEQQIRGLLDRIGKMEADLQGGETLKKDLQQARAEAQSLFATREELHSRIHQLTEDHQRVHIDLQQMPALIAERDSLRQEYQHYSATYDYEKKLYNDHLESLQVMEKNYMTMASEVEKLRAQLTKNADTDRRTGGAYGGFAGYNEKEVLGHYPGGQNPYEDAYGVAQGHGPLPGGGAGGGAGADRNTPPVGTQPGSATVTATTATATIATGGRSGYDVQRANTAPGQNAAHAGSSTVPAYNGGQRGPTPTGAGYDAQRGGPTAPIGNNDALRGGPSAHNYDAHRYDPYRGGPAGYDPYRGPEPAYDAQRGPIYDNQRGPTYDGQRGSGYEAQVRAPGYDANRGGGANFDSPNAAAAAYDAQPRGAPQGQTQAAQVYKQANNVVSYGSEAPTRGGNPARR